MTLTAEMQKNFTGPGVDALWGAKAIAGFLGCTVDRIYRWVDDPNVPIYRRGGHYLALRSELREWLHGRNLTDASLPE